VPGRAERVGLARVGPRAAIGDADESVQLDEHPDLTIGSDDLLVDMEAATVNRTDLLLAAGRYGVRPQLPAALGAEGVGRVREVGADADPSLAGRRVLGAPDLRAGNLVGQGGRACAQRHRRRRDRRRRAARDQPGDGASAAAPLR
jgi:NADPH:quinone reductase-like Zn-dependent oxidoreductase